MECRRTVRTQRLVTSFSAGYLIQLICAQSCSFEGDPYRPIVFRRRHPGWRNDWPTVRRVTGVPRAFIRRAIWCRDRLTRRTSGFIGSPAVWSMKTFTNGSEFARRSPAPACAPHFCRLGGCRVRLLASSSSIPWLIVFGSQPHNVAPPSVPPWPSVIAGLDRGAAATVALANGALQPLHQPLSADKVRTPDPLRSISRN